MSPDITTSRNWRDAVAIRDDEGHRRMVDYLSHVTGKEVLPEATRETILFAVSAALRFQPSARTHAAKALESGATVEELVHACQLAGLSAGFTAVIVGMDVIDDLDT